MADDEMQAAPSAADSIGRRLPALVIPVDVMTDSPYGTDMDARLREVADSSQSHFDADQIEAMSGCVELINTGRAGSPDQLRDASDLQRLADRYAFGSSRASPRDLPAALNYRAQLDSVVTACEAGAESAAIARINALLTATGAIPQIAAHDGRGPHLHVSSPTSPLPDRMAAHFAMGLAWLVVAGQIRRIRTCASPACQKVFVDFSRNSSRRYCDSRTCGNRMHVAAYRARRRQSLAFTTPIGQDTPVPWSGQ
jgi:predicted RNA-binding Zn ribbon-like protein